MSLLDALGRARDAIHRDCRGPAACACACGCGDQIGCACFTPLCLQCHMDWLRGRENDDGTPDCEPPAVAVQSHQTPR